MIYINYHVKIDGSLNDALETAYDIYLNSGLEPDSIDYDGVALAFDERDAMLVTMNYMTASEYAKRHEIKPVLSDSEESD